MKSFVSNFGEVKAEFITEKETNSNLSLEGEGRGHMPLKITFNKTKDIISHISEPNCEDTPDEIYADSCDIRAKQHARRNHRVKSSAKFQSTRN